MAKAKPQVEADNIDDDSEDAAPVATIAPRAVRRHLPTYEIQPEGIKWGRWAVLSSAEHTIEDVLDPGYLFSKAEQFKGGDYIEIKHPFGAFCVCLDVVRIDMQARGIVAYVRHIFDYSEAKPIAPRLDGVRIERLGSSEWTILDGQHVISDNFPTRAAAEKWLAERRAA